MKHFIRVMLIIASTFMLLGNISTNNINGILASSLFLVANSLAFIYNFVKVKVKIWVTKSKLILQTL